MSLSTLSRTPAIVALAALAVFAPGAGASSASITIQVSDRENRAVREAAVYLVPAGADAPHAAAAERPTAIMDQRDRRFVPHILVVREGTEVGFPNSDSVSHHVYSFSRPNDFELPLYKGKARESIRFEHAGLVTLGCNIHDQMLGYILIVTSSHFGLTNADGMAEIADVPAGAYRVEVWTPRLPKREAWIADTIHVSGASVTQAHSYRFEERLRAERNQSGGSLAWDDY